MLMRVVRNHSDICHPLFHPLKYRSVGSKAMPYCFGSREQVILLKWSALTFRYSIFAIFLIMLYFVTDSIALLLHGFTLFEGILYAPIRCFQMRF